MYLLERFSDSSATGVMLDETVELGNDFQAAEDAFFEYQEIYGDECALILTGDLKQPIKWSLPTKKRFDISHLPHYKFDPYVGLPATMSVGSDSYAGVITSVERNGSVIRWGHNGARLGEGAEYTRRQDGHYREKGSNASRRLILGYAKDYRDPSF